MKICGISGVRRDHMSDVEYAEPSRDSYSTDYCIIQSVLSRLFSLDRFFTSYLDIFS